SLLIRGPILPAVRQKLHLSPCADSRNRLYRASLARWDANFSPSSKTPRTDPATMKGTLPVPKSWIEKLDNVRRQAHMQSSGIAAPMPNINYRTKAKPSRARYSSSTDFG